MKVKKVIKLLKKLDKNKELYIFADGNLFPALEIKETEDFVEIGCGWSQIDEEDEEYN